MAQRVELRQRDEETSGNPGPLGDEARGGAERALGGGDFSFAGFFVWLTKKSACLVVRGRSVVVLSLFLQKWETLFLWLTKKPAYLACGRSAWRSLSDLGRSAIALHPFRYGQGWNIRSTGKTY